MKQSAKKDLKNSYQRKPQVVVNPPSLIPNKVFGNTFNLLLSLKHLDLDLDPELSLIYILMRDFNCCIAVLRKLRFSIPKKHLLKIYKTFIGPTLQ